MSNKSELRVIEQPKVVTSATVEHHDDRQVSRILDRTTQDVPTTLTTQSGRRVSTEPSDRGDVVRIESPDGRVELLVTMTEDGPLLSFESADVRLSASRSVAIECESLDIHAKKQINQTSGGDLRETVHGNKVSKVKHTHASLAGGIHIESKRTDVKVVANDEVKLLGEQIKLNCE